MFLGLLDAGLVLAFAVLVALDALTRVPTGHVIVARSAAGAWRVCELEHTARWAIVAPWSPVNTAVVVAWAPLDPVSEANFSRRLESVAKHVRILVGLGLMHLAAFVVGVPVLVAYWGGSGLMVSMAVVVGNGMLIALVASLASRRIDAPMNESKLTQWARWLSPFSAAAAAQDVVQRATQGVPAASVARVLLPPEAFVSWLRPFAWDHAVGPADEVLRSSIGELELQAIARAAPPRSDGTARSYCPRCATLFVFEDASCPVCQLTARAFEADVRANA